MSNLVHSFITKSFAGVVADRDGINKRIEITAQDYYQTEINGFKIGDKVTVNVTNQKPKRTEAQNRYLFGAYYPMIAAETGHSVLEIHEWAKGKCLPSIIIEVYGDKVRMKKSTTELTINEFAEFIAAIETITGIMAPPTEGYYD